MMPGVALDIGLARIFQQDGMKDAFCTAVTDDSSTKAVSSDHNLASVLQSGLPWLSASALTIDATDATRACSVAQLVSEDIGLCVTDFGRVV